MLTIFFENFVKVLVVIGMHRHLTTSAEFLPDWYKKRVADCLPFYSVTTIKAAWLATVG